MAEQTPEYLPYHDVTITILDDESPITRPTSNEFSRRSLLLKCGAAAAVLAVGYLDRYIPNGEQITSDAIELNHDNYAMVANKAYHALEKYFSMSEYNHRGLYYDAYPNRLRNTAMNWPFSHVMAATIDMCHVNSMKGPEADILQSQLNGLWNYWDGSRKHGLAGYTASLSPTLLDGAGKDLQVLLDDNEWTALNLIRIVDLLDDPISLNQALRVFDLVKSEWNDDPDVCAPGGVNWEQGNTDSRNTVSTAPGVLLGLRIANVNQDESYTKAAIRMYSWPSLYLKNDDGLFEDNVKGDCHIDKTIYTYNQAIMISNNVLLWKQTGNDAFLVAAEEIATAAMTYFAKDKRLLKQPIEFNAIFFRHLLHLTNASGNSGMEQEVRTMAADYLGQIWDRFITNTSLNKTKRGKFFVIEQAAIVQLVAILALPKHQQKYLI
jgi:hypothetical protein